MSNARRQQQQPGSSEVITEQSSRESTPAGELPRLVLYGEGRAARSRNASRPGVTWTQGTVDNEHLNRKKSKICCIFHPTTEFGESSDESEYSDTDSSSSDSDSDSEPNYDPRQHLSNGHRQRQSHSHGHSHSHDHEHHDHHDCQEDGQVPRRAKGRPNAYERQPKIKRRPQ